MNPCPDHKDCQIYHLGQSGERPVNYDLVVREWAAILSHHCRMSTSWKLYCRLTCGPAYNTRLIWHTGPKLAEYIPGQSYLDEVRTIRRELLK